MKRLIVTGLPCPPEPWRRLFNDPAPTEQKILSLADILNESTASNLRALSRVVDKYIEQFQPDSIVCHDVGVPLTLLSLLRLSRKGIATQTRVTLFNGPFRRINIFGSVHPWRSQYLPYRRMLKEAAYQNGEFDPRLRLHLARIRALYRQIIFTSLTDRLAILFGIDDLIQFRQTLPLRNPVQIIASNNDPYLKKGFVDALRKELPTQRVLEVDYGHFPYSVAPSKILPLIQEFEADA